MDPEDIERWTRARHRIPRKRIPDDWVEYKELPAKEVFRRIREIVEKEQLGERKRPRKRKTGD